MGRLKIGRPSLSKEKALQHLLEAKDMMKMNINIEKSFHKEVKRFALERDMTMTEVIHKSLQEYMKK